MAKACAPVRLHTVLFRPTVPNNTGAIGRLCLGFHSSLHIVGPAGFDLSDARAKRAGLDYWPHVDKHMHADEAAFASTSLPDMHVMLMLSKAAKFGAQGLHTLDLPRLVQQQAPSGHCGPVNVAVCLGSETEGITFLPHSAAGRRILQRCAFLYVPMDPGIRSHNLANTAAMALWEVTRQCGHAAALDAMTARA